MSAKNNEKLAYKEFRLGHRAYDLNNFRDAARHYKNATILLPSKAVSWYCLANTFLQIKQYAKALRAINEAIKLDSGEADYFFALGDILRNKKQFRDAVSAYNSALDLRPHDIGVLNNLSITYSDMKRHNTARALLVKALEESPRDADLLRNLALVEHECGDGDSSVFHSFQAALTNPELWGLIAGDFRYQKRYRESLIAQHNAIVRSPDDADLYQDMGNILMDMSRYKEAAEQFKLALRINPKKLAALYQISICYVNVGDEVAAEQALTTAINVNTDPNEIPEKLFHLARRLGLMPDDVDHVARRSNLIPARRRAEPRV